AIIDVCARGRATVSTPGSRSSLEDPYVRIASRGGLICDVTPERLASPPEDAIFRAALVRRYPEIPAEPAPPTTLHGILPRDLAYRAGRLLAEARPQGFAVLMSGNVEIAYKEYVVRADAIYFKVRAPRPDASPVFESVYAEGAVTLIAGASVVHSQRLYLNDLDHIGLVQNSRVRFFNVGPGINATFHIPEARQVSAERYAAPDASVTTSTYGDPPWRLQGHNVSITRPAPLAPAPAESQAPAAAAPAPPLAPDDLEFAQSAAPASTAEPGRPKDRDSLVVAGWHNVFYAGDIPILYWPYLQKDIRDPGWLIRSVRLGSRKYFGATVQTDLDLYDLGFYANNWSDLTWRMDYYAERGAGYGPVFDYDTPDRFGQIQYYGIRDNADYDDSGVPVTDRDRYRFLMRHREFLSDHWRFDGEVSKSSDYNFLRTYFRDEYDNGKEQETYGYLRRLQDNSAFMAIYKTRLNDFDYVVERRPSVSYHQVAQPIGGSGLVWTHDTDFSNLRLLYSEQDDPNINDNAKDVLRFNSAHELALPFTAGPAVLSPFVEGQATAWNKEADSDTSSFRGAAGFGARASTTLYRTYEVQSKLFDVDRVRHILTPKAEYHNLPYVSEDPDKYIQNDEVDALDKTQKLSVGLRSRWQTKRGEPNKQETVDFVTFEITQNSYIGDEGANAGKNDYTQVDLIWLISDRLTFMSLGD
ncbi:MAG TPA: LPS assembly protein LptD, partial [Candidatus Brocadiia bacterium]|nr:LPS assembly protein LptD [Candidatus Brocadiia bacterium]